MKNSKGLTIIALSTFFLLVIIKGVESEFNLRIPYWVSFTIMGIGFLLMAINVFWVQRANRSYQLLFAAYTLIFGLLIFFNLKS